MLQVTSFDLDGSLELHILEIAVVAGSVHHGLPDLQQCANVGDGQQAVVRDRRDRRGQ
jgi:hypothetical protein